MKKLESIRNLSSILLLVGFVFLTAYKVNASEKTGRPVRVVSLNFYKKSLSEIEKIIDDEGAKGSDIIVLPETWRGQTAPETLEGETITALSKLAKKHNTYNPFPDRQKGWKVSFQ